MSKIIIFIVVIVLIVIGWMYWSNSNQDQVITPVTMVSRIPQSATPTPASAISTTDTSNAALDADLKTVDGNLTNLGTDSANADAGLKDQSTY